MAKEADERVGPGPDQDADAEDLHALGLKTRGDALRHAYSLLSEFTHPNRAAMTHTTGNDSRA